MSDCICSSVEHCSYHYCDEHRDERRPCFVCGYNERQAELRKAEKERDRYKAALEALAKQRAGEWEKCEGAWPDGSHMCCTHMSEIAKRALEGKE